MRTLLLTLGRFTSALCLAIPLSAAGANAQTFSSVDNVVCPTYYQLDRTKGECAVKDAAEIKKLDVKKGQCEGEGLKNNDGVCAASDTKPTPRCLAVGGYSSKLSGSGATLTCSYDGALSTSSPGDYIGDCLKTDVVPAGTTIETGQRYLVTAQKTTDNDDRELTVIKGKISWWLSCASLDEGGKGETHKVLASQMAAVGASRFGYAYGFLTMPYKYFPSEKSFQANIPIGGYMGWRYGAAGSGTTVAAAVTLSTVKANTVDPNTLNAAGRPTVTGTADVAALSFAAGFMFDVLKSPAGKPFKAGVFFGRDIVNQDPTIDYKYNRKNWVAIQIGYAFTDN